MAAAYIILTHNSYKSMISSTHSKFLAIRCAASVILIFLISACASVQNSIAEKGSISTIKAWSLDFKYENAEIEERADGDGKSSLIKKHKGNRADNLQFLDDVLYLLRDEYNLNVTKKKDATRGQISVHLVQFASGGIRTAAVYFTDASGEELGRIKVSNGDRNATYKTDDSFAKFVSKAISEALAGGK